MRLVVKKGNGHVGFIRSMDTFNGLVSIPRGWFILNGLVLNQANYDAIHGAGTYLEDNIASSPLINKNQYNASEKYPLGVDSITQDGSVARTYTGNSGNTINLQHNHRFYNYNGTGTTGNSYDSAGASQPMAGGTTTSSNAIGLAYNVSPHTVGVNMDSYNQNQLSTSQSIKPHSFGVIYIIKVR